MEKENEHKDIVLNRQANGLPTTERVRSVFSLATPLDLAIIAVSCVAAIVAGGLNPLLTVSITTRAYLACFDKRTGSVRSTR
jgi:hypothetical protein